MRRLVITEKNNTAVRIAVILSGGSMQRSYPNRVPVFDFSRDGVDYRVIGLRGHILNLDYPDAMNDWEGTDLRDLVRAEPVKRVVATNIVASLREVCRDIDEIIVATDFDREGELIGTEALEVIAEVRPGLPIKRARYSALTKSEIEGAFGALVEMDYPLALAAASRQVIDLGWGAALTRFISLAANQRGRDFLSVGRVQSPTLALIVDREREIVEFVPKDYWTVHATFEKDGTEFEGRHAHGQFWNEAEANAARDRATGAPTAAVTAYRGEVKEERPPVPYSTTLFLGDATRIGFAAAHAMDVAESLYQSGLISYPRTDNTVYPGSLSLRGILEKLKDTELGREAAEILAQPSIRATRGRTETTDHPPIYPVGAAVKSKLRPDHWRIYELVTRRFLATLAPNAKAHDSGATLDVNGQMFEASGYRVLEPGWRKYFTLYEARESTLPELVQGGSVAVKDVPPPRHDRTRPPNRYSQGALIQEMERLQLGTKSTRHDIIQKLYDRKYVEGKVLQPTETGMAVTEALEIHAEKITQPEMTALLEKDMDEIARGIKEQSAVIRESQDMLVEVIEVLLSKKEEIGKEIQTALNEQNYIGECRKCPEAGRTNGQIMIRHTARGRKFLGCTNYPQCSVFHSVPPFGLLVGAEQKCAECGSPMVKLLDRKKQEAFCVDQECPSVVKRDRLGPCPKDGGDIMMRMSARGKRFAGCANYPNCDQTYPLPQRGKIEPMGELCEHCRSPRVRVITMGRPPWLICINMECPGKALKAAAKAAKVAAKDLEKKEKKKAAAAAKRAKARAKKKAAAKSPRRKKAIPEVPAAGPEIVPAPATSLPPPP